MYKALFYYSDLTLSQPFQPMTAQLSKSSGALLGDGIRLSKIYMIWFWWLLWTKFKRQTIEGPDP